MNLSRITLANFRNIEAAELLPGQSVTILHGRNGQGKTNLLEGVYILGHARPFRPAKTSELILHEEKQAVIRGNVESRKVNSEIVVQLEGGNRRVKVDGKSIQRSSELHGRLAAVLFSPDDTSMIKLGPETRRRYLDRASYAAESTFLKDYHDYHRTLKQRNHLLKSAKTEGLEVWTEQLADAGARLMKQRRAFASLINEKLGIHYSQISGTEEPVSLSYRPDSGGTEDDRERLIKLFNDNLQTDIRHGTTGRGPHRDDLQFLIGGRSLKTFGSQGQQRTYVLALKMAELDSLQEIFGEPPVLLLDDMSSELDRHRSSNLLAFIRQRGIQSLITTTEITTLPEDMLDESVSYSVEGGRLTYEGTASR